MRSGPSINNIDERERGIHILPNKICIGYTKKHVVIYIVYNYGSNK